MHNVEVERRMVPATPGFGTLSLSPDPYNERRPLYSITFSTGDTRLSTARPATDTDTDARVTQKAISAWLEKSVYLRYRGWPVCAARSIDDRLEAFIFAWAALEMVVRKLHFSVWKRQVDRRRAHTRPRSGKKEFTRRSLLVAINSTLSPR